jgi:phosphatidylinositol 3-kinase
MITTKGIIFHIDFDYILGEDPKPFQPEIRLTKEMILVMGGEKSIYYNNFKEICIKIYNCLRRHVNLFYHLLLYFSKSNPNIDSKYTEEFIKNQVIKRFNPGENYKESTFQFNITIEENYSNNTRSLAASISDKLHYYKKSLPFLNFY